MSDNRSYELKEAVSRMIVAQPFFAVVMFDLLTLVETDQIPTAATDSKRIYVNPKFFNPKPIEERVGILVHEVLHVILQHCQRMRLYQDRGFGPDLQQFNSTKWNYATDYIINDWVTKSRAGKMPVGSLFHPDFTMDDLADDAYLKIPDPPEGDGGNWDIHMPAADDQPTTTDVQRAVAGAANAAKNMGMMPAGMERLVEELTAPQISWKEKLRLSVLRASGRDQSTWARPHRRRLAVAPHIYWPGRTGLGAGTIVMYEDTSVSVSPQELRAFRSEMAGLYSETTPEALYIGSCDTVAYDPVKVESPDDIIHHKAEGGGGTHMPAIFDKLEELNIRPDCLIILTDGYTGFGSPPGYEVVWVISSDVKATHGTTIRIHAGE